MQHSTHSASGRCPSYYVCGRGVRGRLAPVCAPGVFRGRAVAHRSRAAHGNRGSESENTNLIISHETTHTHTWTWGHRLERWISPLTVCRKARSVIECFLQSVTRQSVYLPLAANVGGRSRGSIARVCTDYTPTRPYTCSMDLQFHFRRLRHAASHECQLQEVRFYGRGMQRLRPESAENPGGESPRRQGAQNVINDSRFKWLDRKFRQQNGSLLTVHFELAQLSSVVDGLVSYELVTANDNPGRDPVAWTLAARKSADGWLPWVVLDRRQDAPRARVSAATPCSGCHCARIRRCSAHLNKDAVHPTPAVDVAATAEAVVSAP